MSADDLGPYLRRLREAAGLTAPTVGELAGINTRRVEEIEAGAKDITLLEADKLARVLNTNVDRIWEELQDKSDGADLE